MCGTALQMQLWDTSSSSPLIRHELTTEEKCWSPMEDIHVDVLERIGKFAHIRYLSNSLSGYVYSGALKEVPPSAESKVNTTSHTVLSRDMSRLLIVTNEMNGQPQYIKDKEAVHLQFAGAKDILLTLTVTKESLKSGAKIKVNNQRGAQMQVSMKFKGQEYGLEPTQYATLEVVDRNDDKGYIDLQAGGYWGMFDRERTKSLELIPVKVRISGQQYKEALREFTVQEMVRALRS
jgi:hypothetical protein